MASRGKVKTDTKDKRVGDQCGVCRKEVLPGDNAVACDACGVWHHCICGDVSPDVYKALRKFDGGKTGTALHWYCQGCKSSLTRMSEEISALTEKCGKLESELNELKKDSAKGDMEGYNKLEGELKILKEEFKKEKSIKGVAERDLRQEMECMKKEWVAMKTEKGIMSKVMDEVKQESEGLKKMWTEVVSAGKDAAVFASEEANAVTGERKIRVEVAEAVERENRKKNLVIKGIPEVSEAEDNDFVKEVIMDLLEGEPVRFVVVERVGRKGAVGRPIRIRVEDFSARRRILMKAKTLKDRDDDKLKKIYIMPDLTREQQKDDKTLRDKAKEFRTNGVTNVKIFKGDVIREEGGIRETLYKREH